MNSIQGMFAYKQSDLYLNVLLPGQFTTISSSDDTKVEPIGVVSLSEALSKDSASGKLKS